MRLSQKLESLMHTHPPTLYQAVQRSDSSSRVSGTGILREQSCGFVPVTAVCLVKVCCVRSYPVIVIES